MNNKEDLLTLEPMESYKAPELPTYTDAKPNLEQKIPRRWQSKAVNAAIIGVLGTAALSGCGNGLVEQGVIQRNGITSPRAQMQTYYCQNLHHGGAGGAPIYVAYNTEQEVLGMIRNRFGAAGLNFREVSPPLSVTIDDVYTELGNFGHVHTTFRAVEDDIYLHLINEATGVGLVVVPNWFWWPGSPCEVEVQARITQRFLLEHGINVYVFFDRGKGVHYWERGVWEDDEWHELDMDEVTEQAYVQAQELMGEQIEAFIRRQPENN